MEISLRHIKRCVDHPDHNVIHLLPNYKAMLKRTKADIKQIQMWSEINKDQLRECFDNTNLSYNIGIIQPRLQELKLAGKRVCTICSDFPSFLPHSVSTYLGQEFWGLSQYFASN